MVLASALHWLLRPDLKPLLDHGTPVFLVVVAAVIFAECGLLLGFFLPGDSFLFAAGLVADQAIGLGGRHGTRDLFCLHVFRDAGKTDDRAIAVFVRDPHGAGRPGGESERDHLDV